jgi:hypothetical protein
MHCTQSYPFLQPQLLVSLHLNFVQQKLCIDRADFRSLRKLRFRRLCQLSLPFQFLNFTLLNINLNLSGFFCFFLALKASLSVVSVGGDCLRPSGDQASHIEMALALLFFLGVEGAVGFKRTRTVPQKAELTRREN